MSFKVGLVIRSLLALSASCLALSCASSDRDSEPAASARSEISGGQPDSVDSNVFSLVSERGKAGVALCSASLIAPNLLLTARHCVSDVTEEQVTCGKTMASAPFAASTFLAGNASSIDDVSMPYRALSVSVPSEGSDICGYDLALITLATNVPASAATPLVPRIDRAVARGELYSAVGYGLDSVGDQGVAGLRRARAGLAVSCIPGSCGEGVEASEFVGEVGVCSGDSGGPALDAAGKVVGVVSRSGADCAHPVYGSVASWKDWMIQIAEQAAERGNYVAPLWVKTGLSDPAGEADAGASSAAGAGQGASAKLGKQGDQCVGPEECSSAFACYSPTNSATNAYCAQLCNEQADCPSGTACSTAFGVCLGKASAASDSSCALRVAAPGRGTPLPALVLTASALFVLRKRKRASFLKRVSS